MGKAQTKSNYDRLSRWYDLIAGSSEKKCRNAGLQKLAPRAGERILEIGPGTGHGLVALARATNPRGHVYGVDISSGMLTVAGSRIRQAGLADRVALIHGDAASLPFKAGAFDAVFVSFALELLGTPEIPKVLGECRRVLRSSGRLVVVSLLATPKRSLASRLYDWAHRQFPSLIDCRPIPVANMLSQARFDILDATAMSMWGLPVTIVLATRP